MISIPSALTVPFMSGSTRSLMLETKLKVNSAIPFSSVARGLLGLQAESLLGKKFFGFHLARRQSLLVRITGDGIEHRLIGFDAVGEWIVADHFARHRYVFRSEEKRAGNLLQQFLAGGGFGFDEPGVKVERYPGIFFVDVAADNVGVVDRQKAVFLMKSRSFGHAIRKQRADLAPIAAAGDPAGAIQRVCP